jgi:hypothetical protein
MTKDPRTLKHIENDMVRAILPGEEFLVLLLNDLLFELVSWVLQRYKALLLQILYFVFLFLLQNAIKSKS